MTVSWSAKMPSVPLMCWRMTASFSGTVTGFTITSQPANGSLIVNPDLTVTYTPDPDYNGPDQFEYQFTGMSTGLEFEFYQRAPGGDTVDNIDKDEEMVPQRHWDRDRIQCERTGH